jgi:Lysylphosphatidylglycerol synthase TM region
MDTLSRRASARSRWLRTAGFAVTVAGALLLVWSIRTAGAPAVADAIRHLGPGFVVVCALGGLRCVLRTVAWRLCLEEASLLTFGRAFSAYLAGGAIGNISPFGFFISEPSKVVLVKDQLAASASIAALAVENLFYIVSVAFMLVTGTTGLLVLAAPLPMAALRVSLTVLAVVVGATLAGTWAVAGRRRLASTLAARLGAGTSRLRDIEDRVFGFAERHPDRWLPVALCQVFFQASAVFEIWLVLRLITGHAPSLLTAFVFESVNRTITIAFQFVPMWLGVDEAGNGLIAAALGISPAAGVSLALARKGRILLWTTIGLALLWPSLRATGGETGNAGVRYARS